MVPGLLAAGLLHNQLWFALPLITAISLVYGATRDERPIPILQNALRAAVWIVGFMAIVFVVLWLVSLLL
jgi:hypothetical protein